MPFLLQKGKIHPLLFANLYAAKCVCVCSKTKKIYVAINGKEYKGDVFMADNMEDAICNQTTLLVSTVVWVTTQVYKLQKTVYASWVTAFMNGWVMSHITRV